MDKKFIGVIGGVLAIIGFFLPWTSVGGLSASGFDATGASAAMWAFPAIGAAIAALAFLNQKWSNIIGIIVALLGGAFVVLMIVVGMEDGNNIGMGLYLTTVGCLVAIIGMIMAMRQPAA